MPLGPAAITEIKPVVAYVGLGANVGEPRRQLAEALARLTATEEVEVVKVSSFYLNPPLGPPDQPWYVNTVAQVRTRLTPEESTPSSPPDRGGFGPGPEGTLGAPAY